MARELYRSAQGRRNLNRTTRPRQKRQMKTTYRPKETNKTAWTEFWDMHSGGDRKLDWSKIYIQGDVATARRIFEEKFGRDPDNVTCSCCGPDYSVTESGSLEEATGYSRKAKHTESGYVGGVPLADYENSKDVLIVYTTSSTNP